MVLGDGSHEYVSLKPANLAIDPTDGSSDEDEPDAPPEAPPGAAAPDAAVLEALPVRGLIKNTKLSISKHHS